MESNKDEALKCLSIAKKALDANDFAKAIRFTQKSIRLYPTPQGDQMLVLIKQKNSEPSRPAPTDSTFSTPQAQKTKQEPPQERKYTTEQLHAVKTILACGKDYYKVLSIERTATDTMIKKAYRKKALQFHPDKNSAPGADEAFKLIAKAFDVLSDSNKRAVHDQGGDADMSRGRSSGFQNHHHHHQYQYHRRRGEEVSPEDLFNMFFGGGGANMRTQQRYRQQRQNTDDLGDLGGLSQMLPLILLVIIAMIALLFSSESEQLYTFYPSTKNTQLRNTSPNNVNYYVNPNVFDTQIKNNVYKLKRTERHIEVDWLNELRSGCQVEQRTRANLLAQYNGLLFGIGRDEDAYRRVENMKLEKCDELRRLAPKIRG